jgi:virulence-associated protein VapD
MYCIAYDFDTAALESILGSSYRNAYTHFKKFMKTRGFRFQQCSLLYADPTVTSVDAVLAIKDASAIFPWLQHCVSDMRLLMILCNDDLRPAVIAGAKNHKSAGDDSSKSPKEENQG